jgi:tRNA (uracil-5-)-methyltransferase
MYKKDGGYIKIDECPMVIEPIFNLMPKLLDEIKKDEILSKKLFRIDFLSGMNQEVLVSLIYHKRIDKKWEERAKKLFEKLNIDIVGRSRGVKIVISKDYIYEKLPIKDKIYTYIHHEGSFTQPNPFVNKKMIEWALENSKDFKGDLLELYCGSGNFTLPLSQNFNKVLATEISKLSIKAAKRAKELNGVKNLEFLRMSSEEFSEALEKKREFNRLKDIDLDSYNFTTLFVDPPRCGLDKDIIKIAKRFKNIIYISCNPETLLRDLEELKKDFHIEKLAFFDQFPYTPHLESGVILTKH